MGQTTWSVPMCYISVLLALDFQLFIWRNVLSAQINTFMWLTDLQWSQTASNVYYETTSGADQTVVTRCFLAIKSLFHVLTSLHSRHSAASALLHLLGAEPPYGVYPPHSLRVRARSGRKLKVNLIWHVSVSGGVKLECLIIKDMQEKAQLHKKVLHTHKQFSQGRTKMIEFGH